MSQKGRLLFASDKTLQWNHQRSRVLKCYRSSCTVQFSSVMSNSLRPHKPRHTRPPCPSPTTGVHPNPCPLGWWCHPNISSCHPLLLPSIFPSIRVFSNESAVHIRWPKYWSFRFISPSNEHPGLISFKMDWLDLLAVQGTLKSSPTPQAPIILTWDGRWSRMQESGEDGYEGTGWLWTGSHSLSSNVKMWESSVSNTPCIAEIGKM